MTYQVSILPPALKAISKLDRTTRDRIMAAIDDLANDPRPTQVEKLAKYELWRVRVGDYRIVYEVDDRSRLVAVVRVGNRRDIYQLLDR